MLLACGQGPYYTIADAFMLYAKNVVKVGGVANCSTSDESDIPAAVAAAKTADTVVLAVGTDLTIAAEGKDATNLTLSPAQASLVREVLSAAKGKVLVLLTTAVPLDISDLLSNDKVGSIVHLGVPGTQAIGAGDVLFGKKQIAGRLIQTWYPKEFGSSLSIFDMNLRPGPSQYPRPDCAQRPASACPRAVNPCVDHLRPENPMIYCVLLLVRSMCRMHAGVTFAGAVVSRIGSILGKRYFLLDSACRKPGPHSTLSAYRHRWLG